MLNGLKRVFDDSSIQVKSKIIGMYLFLLAANVGGWIYAFATFHSHPVFIGTALLSWGFGLRHAVDADHIAAIDNVTRKLMQQDKRPVTVGFFFSMGHSLVLVIGVAAIYFVRSNVNGDSFNSFNNASGIIGTVVSTAFLLVIGIMNLLIAMSIYRTFKNVTGGGAYVEDDFDMLLNKRGFLSRIFRPLFNLVNKGWHMLPVGFLFGLGFDTVTEVSLLGIAATEANQRHAALVYHDLSLALRRRNVVDRYDGWHRDAGSLWLGFREAGPQALLQSDDHVGFSLRCAGHRGDRGAGPRRPGAEHVRWCVLELHCSSQQ